MSSIRSAWPDRLALKSSPPSLAFPRAASWDNSRSGRKFGSTRGRGGNSVGDVKYSPPKHRPVPLDGASLEYPPENELGVVFLFAALRKKFGVRVELIRAGFPDCIARQGTKRIRIEFEYKSRNFRTHKHPGKQCDWLVCWEHNWPDVHKHFKRLKVVELRREFGLGFNVWFQPVGKVNDEDYAKNLASGDSWPSWSVPSLAMEDDLLLYWRTGKASEPNKCVQDIFRVAGSVKHSAAVWRGHGEDYHAAIERVCTLGDPLQWEQMQKNPVLKYANFMRGQMQGRPRATPYWLELHRMIIDRNPGVERALRKYGPDRLT